MFIDQNVKIALTDEISNGRVNQFRLPLALQSNDPELVWKDVLTSRTPILENCRRDAVASCYRRSRRPH